MGCIWPQHAQPRWCSCQWGFPEVDSDRDDKGKGAVESHNEQNEMRVVRVRMRVMRVRMTVRVRVREIWKTHPSCPLRTVHCPRPAAHGPLLVAASKYAPPVVPSSGEK